MNTVITECVIHIEFKNITGIPLQNVRIIPVYVGQIDFISEIPPFSIEPFQTISKYLVYESNRNISGEILILFQDDKDILSLSHECSLNKVIIDVKNEEFWEVIKEQMVCHTIPIPCSVDSNYIYSEMSRIYQSIPNKNEQYHLFITLRYGLGIISLYPSKVHLYTFESGILTEITSKIESCPNISKEAIYFSLGYRIVEFQTMLDLNTDTGMLLSRLTMIIQYFHNLSIDPTILEGFYSKINQFQVIAEISNQYKQELYRYFEKFVNQFSIPTPKVLSNTDIAINEKQKANLSEKMIF